jgi:protein phosphatase
MTRPTTTTPPHDGGVTRIELRDPTLVVLVGAAGSGKSTFAARWFAPSEILSSDTFREILTGDPSDQRATKTAFSIIHREVTKRLAAKRTVVVDATNVEAAARRQLIARARFAGVPAIAIVFALPRDVVLARNAARPGRVVNPAVVERHLERLETALPDLPDEGFTDVVVLRKAADADTTEIGREGSSAAAPAESAE